MDKPLSDVKILDMTAYLAGPFCTTLLGAMGAEVILVERPKVGDPVRRSTPFAGKKGVTYYKEDPDDIAVSTLHRNRNKKGITVNLKSEKGKEIIRKLVPQVDILVENFTPGVMDRLGLGYESLKKIHPGLVYCAISGFGQTGPNRDMRAYNITAQAMSGTMHLTGFPDGPPTKCGLTIGDYVAAVWAMGGILAALHRRNRTGQGEMVDISMQDCLFCFLMDWLDVANVGKVPMRKGNSSPRAIPTNSFKTSDGYMVTGVYSDEQWHNLCRAMEREDLIGNPKYDTYGARLENEKEVTLIVAQWAEQRTTKEAVDRVTGMGVSCAPVKTVEELLTDEHILQRGMYVDLPHPRVGQIDGLKGVGFPIKFSEAPVSFDSPAPDLGQHTEEILHRYLGYTREEIQALEKEGAI